MNLNLDGRQVLVAGASQGIGAAIAEAFLFEGAKVIISARNQDRLNQTEQRLNAEYNDNVKAIKADLAVGQEIDMVLSLCETLDIVVVNYGATDSELGFETPDLDWHRLIGANLSGPARLAKSVAKKMVKSEGASKVILFIGSIAGREAVGAPIAYSVGKSGLRVLTKIMAHELAEKGVRVNLLSPGNIIFEGGRWEKKLNLKPTNIRKLIKDTVPMNRFGTPEEIASVATFMCSDRASFMTGADVVVDGGQSVSFI